MYFHSPVQTPYLCFQSRVKTSYSYFHSAVQLNTLNFTLGPKLYTFIFTPRSKLDTHISTPKSKLHTHILTPHSQDTICINILTPQRLVTTKPHINLFTSLSKLLTQIPLPCQNCILPRYAYPNSPVTSYHIHILVLTVVYTV